MAGRNAAIKPLRACSPLQPCKATRRGWSQRPHRLFSQNLSISQEKLTCLYTTNSGPTTKTQEDTVAEFGTVAGAKDIRTKSRSPRHGGIRKGTGDCPPVGRASVPCHFTSKTVTNGVPPKISIL